MVKFKEKPRSFEGFYFHGGFESFKEFAKWAHEHGLMAAYQPDQVWVLSTAEFAGTVPINRIPELVYIRNRGYIKGAPDFTMALEAGHWFIIEADGQFVMMTHKAVEDRFTVDGQPSRKEFERVRLLQGGSP